METKVALVTGATQGLGRALAEGLLARLGSAGTVYVTGRDPERTARVTAELEGNGAQARAEVLDVGSDTDVERVAARLAEQHGGVDVVFSNAYQRVDPSDDPAEVIAQYININNLGTTRILRAFAPLMRDGGRLIVVASTMGTLHHLAPVLHDRFDPLDSLDDVDRAVCAWRDAVEDGSWLGEAWPAFINVPSKIAQVAAVRTLAYQRRADDRRRDVLLAAVCPGMIDTPASRPWFDTTRAQTPAQAAGPLLDLAVGPAPDPEFYGELVRFGKRLPWSGEAAASGRREP